MLDEPGFLSAAARATLDGELEAFERRQGSQVLVAVFRRLPEGVALEEWTQRVAESWRVGRARQDDGAVLFLFAEDRQVRLEVGYGLEGALTDLEASRILRDLLIPALRAGDRDAALLGAGRAILAAIEGEYEAGPGAERGPTGEIPLWGIVLLAIAVLLLLSVAGRAGGWRGGPGAGAGSSGWPGGGHPIGRSGGGGFSGGGFSGGGGSFGGGGASGRW